MSDSQDKQEFSRFKKEHKKLSKGKLISMLFYFKQRVEKIERALHMYDNANTPSSKKRFKEQTEEVKEIEKDENRKRFSGKPKGSNGGGLKLPEPDRVVEHRIDKPGHKQVGKKSRTTIDFVDSPLEVVRHDIFVYKDANGNIVEADADLPNGVYGKNLQAFVAMLKGRTGISHGTIADLIQSIRPDLSYSAVTNLNIIDAISEALEPTRAGILAEIRNGDYCHMDETGLRQDGQNGYTWIACNPTNAIYEYDRSRAGKVAERILGKYFDKIVVSDGYAVYNRYWIQRCWAHILREFRELVEEHKELERDKDYLKELYQKAVDAKTQSPDERTRIVEQLDSEDELGSFITRLENKNNKTIQGFATTMKNARPNLFTGVIYPEIPLTNNHAERLLRKLIGHRNIIGCIRNKKGERFINNTLSCIQTWRLQEISIYEKLKEFAT